MATSPLAAALKPSLPADETSEARYQSALKQMTDALDQRKNRLFDPTLLAMSQGFLAPTQTGSFFESLGNAAKMTLAAEDKEVKENQDIAALRLQMAQAEREMARKQRGLQFLTGATEPRPEGATAEGAAPAGAPAGAPAAAATPTAAKTVTQGDRSGLGVVINGRQITPALIAQISYSDPELGKALESQYKLTMESIAVQPGGYVIKTTGEYVPFGGKAPVTRFIPGDPATNQKAMTLELPEEDAIALDRARRNGDSETFYRIVDMYTKAPARPGAPAPAAGAAPAAPAPGAAPSAAPAAPAAPAAGAGQLAVGTVRPGDEAPVRTPPGVAARTPSEARAAAEVDQKVRETLAVGEATQQLKATGEVRTAGKASLGLLPIYDRMEQILKTPGIDKVMGVLERGDIQSALGNLVEEAIRVGNFSVGIPAVRKILTNSGAPQELIDQAANLGQLLAITQFEQRKGLGSGTSVSNFEQQMVNAMGPNMTDTLRSFKQKLGFLREKARFESELAKALRVSKKQYEEFEDTPEFEKMFTEYRNRVTNIVYPGGTTSGAARPARPAASAAAGAASQPITAEELRNRLRQRSNP
jgi:hypothetical protein